jgi:hypothetical protein
MNSRHTEENVMERTASTPVQRTTPADTGAGNGARDKAEEVAGKAQEQASKATDRAREQVRDQVDRRSTEAGERVRSAAGDARSVAEQLRRDGKDTPAKYAEQAADRAERLGDYLHEADGDRILRDVEDFGRRKPWAVVAGGLAIGFMASRMLKASSTERYRASESYRAPEPYRAPQTP